MSISNVRSNRYLLFVSADSQRMPSTPPSYPPSALTSKSKPLSLEERKLNFRSGTQRVKRGENQLGFCNLYVFVSRLVFIIQLVSHVNPLFQINVFRNPTVTPKASGPIRKNPPDMDKINSTIGSDKRPLKIITRCVLMLCNLGVGI